MRRLGLIGLFICVASLVLAQHSLGLSGRGACMLQLDNIPSARAQVGGTGGIDISYYYQKKAFILTTGLQIGYYGVEQQIDSMYFGDYLLCDRRDKWCAPTIAIPLLMGVQTDHFYALFGATMVFSGVGTTRQYTHYSLGEGSDKYYPDYNQDFLTNTSCMEKGRSYWYPDVRVGAEIGYRIHTPHYWVSLAEWQVGLFAEYGLFNVLQGQAHSKLVEHSEVGNIPFYMNHIYTTLSNADARVNNLQVGVRITCLFNLRGVKDNTCRCLKY